MPRKDGLHLAEVPPVIAALAVHLSPALVASCWAAFSKVPRVKSLMILTAKIVVLAVILLFSFMYLTEYLCEGSALKGYGRCSLIPVSIARLSIPIYLISVGVVLAWFLVAIALCIRAELAATRERDMGH